MNTRLLSTKSQIPAEPRHVIPRARLLDALDVGVQEHKLTLITAPAGYGKSTLLAQWAHATSLPVAWLSLGEEENDVETFMRYLVAAWSELQPVAQESPLGMLLGAMTPDSATVCTALINAASEGTQHVVLVLDDYHLIEEPAVHETMTYLLDHLPPTLHFILSSRGEPSLPVARYRARRQLLEMQAEDLQFQRDEATDFLTLVMGLPLTSDEVDRLHVQLEGWIVGMQLVALGIQRHHQDLSKLTIRGRQRFIADFLREEVLAPLPVEVRDFLLQTSILDRFTADLCAAVTGKPHCQAMLERVERANIFLVPHDVERQWFRYQRLFADFLREELARRYPDVVGECHRRAARWFLEHDQPEQAFRHAYAGQDVDLVVQTLERYFYVKILSGEVRVALQWLRVLPEAWYLDHATLSLHRAASMVATGELDAGARRLDEIEVRLARAESGERRRQMARVYALRCFIACFRNDLPQAEECAQQAFNALPREEFNFRANIHQALGDTYRRNCLWDAAVASYRKALETDQPAFSFRPAHVYGALADLALMQGRLREAAACWQQALATIQARQNWGRLPLPLIGWVYLRLGERYYEWNDLAATAEHLTPGLARAELSGDIRARMAGYLLASRVKLTGGDLAGAAASLEQARPLVVKAHLPEWTERYERLQLELWLAQERFDDAEAWASRQLDAYPSPKTNKGTNNETIRGEAGNLALVRFLLHKGDDASLEQAVDQLEARRAAAQAEGHTGGDIEALVLHALVLWQLGDMTEAMVVLARVLNKAEAEGYVRLFVDLGLPMTRLLQAAHARNVSPEYVATLLEASGANLMLASPRDAVLPEALTPREQEVLELIAAGLTRREIAEKLIVSSETIKKHTSHLYGKLGVHNRTQAVATARELEILN